MGGDCVAGFDCKECNVPTGPKPSYETNIVYDPPPPPNVIPYINWNTLTINCKSTSRPGEDGTPITTTNWNFYTTAPENARAVNGETFTFVVRKGDPSIVYIRIFIADEKGRCAYTEYASASGCFNGEALISLANGDRKQAKEIEIGDEVLSSNGEVLKIIAKTLQEKQLQELFKIDNLYISGPHRMLYDEKWIMAEEFPNAEKILVVTELYNFITDKRLPIIVDNKIVTTIGMFCEGGTHDLEKYPTQRLWCTDKIIELLEKQKTWPNVIWDNELLSNTKNEEWVLNYLNEN